MMKKYLLSSCFLFAFLMSSFSSFCQTNLVRGSKYVSLKYGVSKFSPVFVQGDFGWMYNERMALRFSGYFENGKVGSTVLNYSGGSVEQLFAVFTYKRFSGSLGLGFYGGHEWLRSNRNPIQKQAWVYGGLGIAEIDFAIGDKASLKAEFSQFYLKGSQLGSWFYTGTIGFSYIIN